MKSLNGKIVLVTGANSGMGMATTKALADMGATVVMLCRNEKRGMESLNILLEKSDRKLSNGKKWSDIGLSDLYGNINTYVIKYTLKGEQKNGKNV